MESGRSTLTGEGVGAGGQRGKKRSRGGIEEEEEENKAEKMNERRIRSPSCIAR